MSNRRPPPPWIFGLTALSFGVPGGFTSVPMTFLLRKAGLPVEDIAAVAALTLLPSSYQFLWAPILDVGPRRRTWLALCALIGGFLLGAAMMVDPTSDLLLFEVLVTAGSGISGLVGSCNGGLIATVLPAEQRGKAAGWVNAGNLGGSALGGGLIMWLAEDLGQQAAAIGLALLVAGPSIAAFFIDEEIRPARRAREVFGEMLGDMWRTLKSRPGWSGVLAVLLGIVFRKRKAASATT